MSLVSHAHAGLDLTHSVYSTRERGKIRTGEDLVLPPY